MTILVVEPMKPPTVQEIDSSLESMQKIVGGDIEAVYPFDDPVAIVCNEEGKMLGLPMNRAMTDESGVPYDIVCGTFFVVGIGDEDFTSLTEQQIEKYKDSWETIPGNSDTLLYLGGNEASTHKYISEALGKSTIGTKTHGQTKGRSGSYSTNFQMSGRELLTPDEVRMLDNRYCILFIRGTQPVMDEKYELMEHPAIRYTMDGGGPPYIHHGTAEPPIPGKPLFQTDFDNEKENAAA